jgi:hypothetical protein
LDQFLKLYGLPTWAYTVATKLHLTRRAAQNSFPTPLPVGWVRFGNWLSLSILPVEMTTAMASGLHGHFLHAQRIVIVGLANEYFSYVTTPEE